VRSYLETTRKVYIYYKCPKCNNYVACIQGIKATTDTTFSINNAKAMSNNMVEIEKTLENAKERYYSNCDFDTVCSCCNTTPAWARFTKFKILLIALGIIFSVFSISMLATISNSTNIYQNIITAVSFAIASVACWITLFIRNRKLRSKIAAMDEEALPHIYRTPEELINALKEVVPKHHLQMVPGYSDIISELHQFQQY